MKSLLYIIGCVAISVAVPLAVQGWEPARATSEKAMPPPVLVQIVNESAGEVAVHVDGQFVGTVGVRETLTVQMFPGYRYLEWSWTGTSNKGNARVEVPNEMIWHYVIR